MLQRKRMYKMIKDSESYSRDRESRAERSSREMSRERYGRERSHERESSRDRDRGAHNRSLSGHTNSNDPKLLMSRVFIGNLPHEKVSREELTDMFSKYGHVIAVNILKGFGFVQFENEETARKAVSMENGGLLKGQRVDVKMAAEGKKSKPQGFQPRPNAPYDQPHQSFRERSPVRERGPPPYDRVPPRDPYDDPYRGRPAVKDPYDAYRRDPYADPYAASARDPYAARDPYSGRGPYPGRAPPPPPVAADRPPVDCEITVVDRAYNDYADSIERRLKMSAMLTFVNVLPSEDMLAKAQEDIAKRGIPFNIVVSALNQQHRSITVRILHGTPQEHRNMPLEDALKLVTQSFETYLRALRGKASTPAVPAAPAAAPPSAATTNTTQGAEELINPDESTSYLLHLLADNRFLTVDELNKVIRYLTERRDRLVAKQGGSTAKSQDVAKDESALAQQQQELQAKILSVLGGGDTTTVASSAALQQLAGYGTNTSQAGFGELANNASLMAQGNVQSLLGSGNANGGQSYNLNTPGVQQALDHLMSSSGNLLQNLGGQAGSSHATTDTSQAHAVNAQSALFQGYAAYPGY